MSSYLRSARITLIVCLLCIASGISAQTIKGFVKDQTGEPVIGATVLEQGTTNGVATDLDGNFSINLQSKSQKLKVSYIGMKTKVVSVSGKSDVTITLEDEATSLNDVVVIGYGTVRKKDLTGSVASIGAKDVAAVPVSQIGEAMAGKLAGVNVTTTEGSPDADVKIRVRGGGSLSQDNSPLYVVDGFIVSSISDIAPSEIETIDVLKDGSSTAIYGARGANGVVIITTKSGKEGKTQVNFNASLGYKKIAKEVKVLNPYEYALYQYELGNKNYGEYSDLDIWKSVEGNNWQDQVFGRTGVQRQYNANVSGGNKDIKYNVSFAHNGETSIMEGSGYSKNNINAKINANLNKWLTLDFNGRMAHSKINGLSGGANTNESSAANSVTANTVRYRPVEPLTADDEDESNSTSTQRSPMERILATYKKAVRFNQTYNGGLNWKPFKGITFRTEFGYSWKREDTDNVWAADAVTNSKWGYNGAPQFYTIRQDYKIWRNSNTITYDSKLFGGRDHINVMIGQEWSSESESERTMTGVNFPDASMSISEILSNLSAAQVQSIYSFEYEPTNLLSYFGRVNYTLNEKYLATFTLRADESNKFAEGHRWSYFPSLALAWRMSDEAWLKNTKWLSNLKLRLSFGTAGNDRVPSGVTRQSFSLDDSSGKHAGFGENSATTLDRYTSGGYILANPNLKWETTVTRNLGFDYGFFNGRINGTLDFYWNTTKDLLMKVPLDATSGYKYQYQNFGQTSNKGIELALNAGLLQKKNASINFNFNLSWNANKIDKLNTGNEWQTYSFAGSTINTASTGDFHTAAGASLGEVWGYKVTGFYTVYDEQLNPNGELVLQGTSWKLRDGVNNKSYSLSGGTLYPGGIKYECDEDGNPIHQKLGNTIAKVTGGFGFNGNIGNFDFNLFFNYSLGGDVVNGTKLANSFYAGSSQNYNIVNDFNSSKRYTWIDPATGLNLGKLSTSTINAYGGADAVMRRLCELNANASTWNPAAVTAMYLNSYAVEDASFLRLNTLTVGYTLPKKWLKSIFISNVRIYFTGYNLVTITGYDGYDPEVDTSSKKNPMCPGIDYAAYPKSRSFVGGINITF